MNPWEEYGGKTETISSAAPQTAVAEAPQTSIADAPASAESGPWSEYAGKASSQETFTETAPVAEQTKAPIGAVEGILNDFVKGYAESAAGVNRKLAALSSIIEKPIIGSDYMTQGLKNNASYWTNVAKGAEEHAGGNWLIQAVAAAPITGAEFAPAGASLRGAVAVGGVLSALDEYGRQVIGDEKIQPGQIVSEGLKGGAMMGVAGGAFKALGVSMEKLAPLLPKYGNKIMAKTLKELGVSDEALPKVMADLKGYLPGGKAYKKPEELARLQSEEIGSLKKQHEEATWQEKTLGEGAKVEAEVERVRQETTTKIMDTRDANKTALERLAEKRKQLQEDYRFNEQKTNLEDRDSIIGTQAVHDAKVAEAEKELHDATGQVFGGLYKTLQKYKTSIDDIADASYTEFFHIAPTEGTPVTLVGKNIEQSINAGRLLQAKYEKGIIQVSAKPGLNNQNLDASAKNLESYLNTFLSAEEDGAVRTLQNLQYNHKDISKLVGAKLQAGGIDASLGGDLDLIKSAIDPLKYLDNVSPTASKFFEKLKGQLKEYGDSKDLMEQWEKLLFKNTDAGVVPNTKNLLGAMESPTGKAFLTRVAELEAKSPPGMSILKEARELKAGYDAIKSAQEGRVKQVAEGIRKSAAEREIAFRNSVKEINQMEAKLGDTQGVRALREQVRGLQTRSREEIMAAKEAFEIKMRTMRKDQIAAIEMREKQHFADMEESKAADIIRSWRPKQGMPRVAQNIGAYGAMGGLIGSIASGTIIPAAAGITMQAGLAIATSPIAMSRAFEWGVRNKATIKAVSKGVEKAGAAIDRSKGSRLLQQLLATSGLR